MLRTWENFFKPAAGLVKHTANWLTSSTNGLILTRNNDEVKSNEEIAIYCVHGTGDRCSAFSTLANRLLPILPAQVTHIELVSFKNRAQGKSIEFFARQLKNKIASHHKNIILMGHSRGGLVVAYFAENLAKEISGLNILEVICISSPLRGCALALFPFTTFSSSIYEMQWNSLFLKALTEQIEQSSIKYLYFTGDKDDIVLTTQACINDEKHLQRLTVLDNHGHLSIMTSKRLANAIKDSIDHIVAEQKPAPTPAPK